MTSSFIFSNFSFYSLSNSGIIFSLTNFPSPVTFATAKLSVCWYMFWLSFLDTGIDLGPKIIAVVFYFMVYMTSLVKKRAPTAVGQFAQKMLLDVRILAVGQIAL